MSPGFNLEDYEPVEDRIAHFYRDYPSGRIRTFIIERTDKGFIIGAEIFRKLSDEHPSSTGMAQEIVGSSPVNRTSALENAETSAIGRGLANLGYAAKGRRASREEMSKVQAGTGPLAPEKAEEPVPTSTTSVTPPGSPSATTDSTEVAETPEGDEAAGVPGEGSPGGDSWTRIENAMKSRLLNRNAVVAKANKVAFKHNAIPENGLSLRNIPTLPREVIAELAEELGVNQEIFA